MKKSTLFLAAALLAMCFSSCGRRICCEPSPHNFQIVPSNYAFFSIGEQKQLSIVIMPADYQLTNIIWASSDKYVVTVDKKGLVTSVGYGEAIITASAEGRTATCNIIVLSDTD